MSTRLQSFQRTILLLRVLVVSVFARCSRRAGAMTDEERSGGRWLAFLFLGVSFLSPETHAATVIDTISLPGRQPLALAVYRAQNKLFVTDDNNGSLLIINGATHQIIGTVPIGGAAFEMVVNETQGKVYVASDKSCCTTGITPGTGLISVINARTGQLITQINPGPQGNISSFLLANDERHGKIYVKFHRFPGFAGESGLGVIDAVTNQFISIPGAPAIHSFASRIAINTVTFRRIA